MAKKKKGKKRNRDEISAMSNNDSSSSSITDSNPIDSTSTNSLVEERYPATAQPTSHRKAIVSQFSSWDQAFQAAASITPHDLGDDYVEPAPSDSGPLGSGDILGISRIAKECIGSVGKQEDGNFTDIGIDIDMAKQEEAHEEEKKKQKKKKEKKHKEKKQKKQKRKESKNEEMSKQESKAALSNQEDEDGQLPQQLEGKMITHDNEAMMVLVDKDCNLVYSATERHEDGSMVQIGSIANDGSIDIVKEKVQKLSTTAPPSSNNHTQAGTFTQQLFISVICAVPVLSFTLYFTVWYCCTHVSKPVYVFYQWH